ncbi:MULTISPECIES: lysophospholipid acyltransferase family protein [Eubacterium]|uniref:1-acyl-sn-glycerol-3-phosphate acyltransferase n=2 Tax=Eubacterium TaxID=1730 RepID=A0ABT2M2K4_9FIRM|nr:MULTISPECIES: lysophospholipid acyltransferase family protein [unclassified Eubacterium (in: firmicutes)]MCT7398632.1 1-acyl-sn-glycerol-3-phosphate acyltransferase [Eubacterium sp. LFL-14]CDA28090.1 putative uncharacterized protein [Eubacterium sp. CAG:156]
MKINRIAYMVMRRFYYIPSMMHDIVSAENSKKYTFEERYNKVRNVIKNVNKFGHVKIRCTGTENIPKENGYILFPNHQGLFDFLLIVETHDNPVSVVMRSNLENVILLKQVRKALDGKLIDRDDVRQAIGIINEMKDEVSKGKNFVIFPEGTRSKDGNNPGPFKGGTFKSAMKAKAPIVPVALIDSFKPFDTPGTSEVCVQIHYLKPIKYEEYKDMNTTQVADMVRTRIIEKIKKEEKVKF